MERGKREETGLVKAFVKEAAVGGVTAGARCLSRAWGQGSQEKQSGAGALWCGA